MVKQLTYQNVNTNTEIPPLVKQTSTRTSAEWAGASGDYDPIHYDVPYAKLRRFPDAVVNGRLRVAFLMQLMTNWIGDEGFLRKLECQHRGNHNVGSPITCRGLVTRKYIDNNQHLVECEVWTEDTKGEKTTFGKAVVQLPSKA